MNSKKIILALVVLIFGIFSLVNDNSLFAQEVEETYTASPWSSTTTYYGGEIVSYEGFNYEAQWWTVNEHPGPNMPASYVWTCLDCGASEGTEWEKYSVYYEGDTVIHNGNVYTAQWWTQNEEPGKKDVWVLEGPAN